ncbi:MAG: L,D-transpeptidase [bacterium]
MKPRLLVTIIFSLSLTVLSCFLTYKVFSAYQNDTQGVDDNPAITLLFPDQEYTIFARDLDREEGELVIPTLDSTAPQITYNSHEGILESISSPKDYVIDVKKLRTSISLYDIYSPIAFTPNYEIRDRYTTNLKDYNLHLNQTYSTPLSVSLKDGSKLTDITLSPDFLRSLLKPVSTDINHPLEIDQQLLLSYLKPKLTPKQKEYFNPQIAYQNTKNALNSRFSLNYTPTVLGVDDGPSSSGELAGRYLEIDLSQQKMYFFIGGSLYKTYQISTGGEYETPVGEFHILNKEPKAFSTIYNVWMSYWMAFKYAGDVGAYLGLHEIAYDVDAGGKPFYKHGYYIGDKMTGGCVAMEPKDSREIYNLAYIGMLIRIIP